MDVPTSPRKPPATPNSPSPESPTDFLENKENLQEATRVLGLLSNPQRLLILCRLTTAEELSVGELGKNTNLSQSALSQHLAKLRQAGLVATRRQQQTIFYRIAREDIAQILQTLHALYCRPI